MITKTSLESILQQIANTILLNTAQVNKPGLLDGKMGISIFLYHYSQINSNNIYRDFADELFYEVLNNLYDTMPSDFINGLTGIGWGVNHLLIKKNLDTEDDEIWEGIDMSLKNISHADILYDINIKCPFCSKGIYFIERNDKETVDNILHIYYQMLHQNTRILPLSYLNSLLYIILQENTNWKIYSDLQSVIYANMMNSIKNGHYTLPDVLILANIVEQFKQFPDKNYDYKKWEELLNILDYGNLNGIFNTGLYNLIYDKIESDNSLILSKLETIDIENRINSMLKNVYKNINLYNGLAGVGLTLCNFYQKRYETI